MQTELIVGRSSAVSNIVVPSFAAVSKEHCHIMFDEKEDCFFVYDTSNNGTTTEQIVCPKEQWIPIRNQHFIILPLCAALRLGWIMSRDEAVRTIKLEEECRLKLYGSTFIGTRAYQQDRMFMHEGSNISVAAVCDGMGGMDSARDQPAGC